MWTVDTGHRYTARPPSTPTGVPPLTPGSPLPRPPPPGPHGQARTLAVHDWDVVGSQVLLGLDGHEQGRAAPGRHHLVREVDRLEAQRERTLLRTGTA